MGLNKKHWRIDVSLFVIIIVMGIFVVIELSRTFAFMRQQASSTPNNQVAFIPDTDGSNSAPEVIVEEPIPSEENAFELLDLDGKAVSIVDFKGTPILINFWATWCPPCLEEMPLIQEYADRFDEELVVLAINAGEDEAAVRDFVTSHELSLNFLLDPSNTAARQFRVYGFPTTLFFDEEGNLVSTHIGELNAGLLDRNLLKIGLGE
jgi:thiol-disulfide isomerase/thioredoxin